MLWAYQSVSILKAELSELLNVELADETSKLDKLILKSNCHERNLQRPFSTFIVPIIKLAIIEL